MSSQNSDPVCRFSIALVTASFVLLAAATSFAQQPSLDGAVEQLRAGEFESALDMLGSLDAADDARVSYYRGYALEKLGQCERSRVAYESAASAASSAKLEQVAEDALSGFDSRCRPAQKAAASSGAPAESSGSATTTPGAGAAAQSMHGAGRTGWKVFGWTSAILGGVVLASIPIKSTIEDNAFSRTTPYFEERYGCSIEDGRIDDGSCDKAAMSGDPVYETYKQNRNAADLAERYMLIGGSSLAAAGVLTLLTVAVTRPSAPVQVSVTPRRGGAQVGAVWTF